MAKGACQIISEVTSEPFAAVIFVHPSVNVLVSDGSSKNAKSELVTTAVVTKKTADYQKACTARENLVVCEMKCYPKEFFLPSRLARSQVPKCR
jgi:hypothetical protein